MTTIQAREVSVTEEKRVVTGLVTSTEFIRGIESVLELDYFTNKYLQKVAKWSLKYYKKHKKAPFKHIQDIYNTKIPRLKPVEAELIKELLTDLSKNYEAEHVNVDYISQEAELWIRRRELEITHNNIEILTEQGKLDEAEAELKKFRKISLTLDNSIYINPGDADQREKIYIKKEQKEKNFFKLPGDAGKFLGNHKPGDVLGITASQKKGKSFLLNYYQNQGVMSRLKVATFSIEMTDTETLARTDKSFQPMLSEELNFEAGDYFFPVFDCVMNQLGDCKDRKSKQIVRDAEGVVDVENRKHKPCTKCRVKKPFKYKVCVWDEKIYRETNNRFTVRKKLEPFLPLLDKYSRIVVRPKYSLSYDLIMHDLHQLEHYHNFIPQIIIIDYIDILKVTSRHEDYKLEDERWQLMQELAGQTQCFVITATQGNKGSFEATVLKQTDQAGFYGKGRHVNMMVGINQTAMEKRLGIWRLSMMDGRDVGVDNEDTCVMLQDLKTGQMHIDSYWEKKFSRRY